MNIKSIVWILIIIIVVLGAFFFFTNNQAEAPTENTAENETAAQAEEVPAQNTESSQGTMAKESPATVKVEEIPASKVEPSSATPAPNLGTVIVEYTDNGFVPSTVAVQKGQTVRFINKSTNDMWVAAALHPTHAVYSGTTRQEHCPDTTDTAFDQCGAGSEYTFTFEKAGTWKYHNHLRANFTGSIVVAEQ